MNNGTLLKTFDFPNLNHCNLFLEITIRRCLSLSPESQPLLKQLPFVAHHGPHGRVSGWGRPAGADRCSHACWASCIKHDEHVRRLGVGVEVTTDGLGSIVLLLRVRVGSVSAVPRPVYSVASHRRQVTCDCEHGWFISSFSDDINFHGKESATRQ
jgi:hypothetical protein